MIEENLFALPVTEPVSLFALLLAVILLVPMLFERMRLPGMVGLILAGIVIGPHGLNMVERSHSIVLLATVGLLYVMFIAGLEIDLGQFNRYRQRSIVLGLLSFAIPQVLGTAAGLALGFGWMAALLLGSVLASHTLLAYPIISRMGLGKRLSVTTAVGGTILTDLLALLVLAVVAGGAHGGLDAWFYLKLFGALVVYTLAVVGIVPRLARSFFKTIGQRHERDYVFVLGTMFAVAFLAKVAGIEAIVGAFLAGLVLNRYMPEHSPLLNRVQFVGNAIFIPFFLLATGMLVDVRLLMSDWSTWTVAALMTGIVIFGKVASSWITGACYRYSTAERWTMFGLTVPQAAATLAATLTGHKLGLFSMEIVNGVILMMLVTCIIGPAVVQHFGRQMASERLAEPERVGEGPDRILVPFANPQTAESLLDLAVALRAHEQGEPVLPLMVVRPEATGTVAEVAAAERQLAHAALHLTSADVPVAPLTRVGLNVAALISQAAIETRSSTVILGWNGELSLQERVFGSVIDQVLEHESAATLVAHLRRPLVTVSEVVLLVPPLSEHHPGFLAAIKQVKRLCGHLGTRLTLWTIGDGAAKLDAITRVAPDVPVAHAATADWREAAQRLQALDDPRTMVVFLSAREGDLSWHPMLGKLPHLLADAADRNFLVLYPAQLAGAAVEPQIPQDIVPHHAVVRLHSRTLAQAYDDLYAHVRSHLSPDGAWPDRLPAPQWSETIGQAEVASVRLPDRPDVIVAIGVHQNGLASPGGPEPLKLVFLCLMPEDMPLELQAAYMKWVCDQVGRQSVAERLQQLPPTDEVTGLLRMAATGPIR